MKKIILLVMCFLFVSAFAVEMEKIENIKGEEITEEHLQMFKTEYNENIDQIPGIAISLFGNEKMNLYVEGYENKIVYMIMNEGYITNIGFGELSEKTMNVYTDENTIRNIIDGNIDFAEALQQEKIRYEGVDIVSSIKVGIANIGITIWSWFSG